MIKIPFIGEINTIALAVIVVAVSGMVGSLFLWDRGRIHQAEERGRLATEAECREDIEAIQSEIEAANQRVADLIEQRERNIDAVLEARRRAAATRARAETAEERANRYEKELEAAGGRPGCILSDVDLRRLSEH